MLSFICEKVRSRGIHTYTLISNHESDIFESLHDQYRITDLHTDVIQCCVVCGMLVSGQLEQIV